MGEEVAKDLEPIVQRVRQKISDYEKYAFSHIQGRALRAFFDLAQEYETLDNFYRICVTIPREFLGYESRLYILSRDGRLYLVADSQKGLMPSGTIAPKTICLSEAPYEKNGSFYCPIRGNRRLITKLPFHQAEEIIGMLEAFPSEKMNEKDRLFFEKYANRIGYNLHNKILAAENIRHLRFINNLVADIEHNVIVPNLRYRIFFNRLRRELKRLTELESALREELYQSNPELERIKRLAAGISNIRRQIENEIKEIEKHYENTSLFLETLLRRDHFERGELVLRKRPCRFYREVIAPQLERYEKRLKRRGIQIDNRLGGIPENEDIPLAVDVGLLSQVYANFFSNAEKYTREVEDGGRKVKFMAFGREIIPDFFGPGKPGIKFNVFTTGPHLSEEDVAKIFEEGYRGDNIENEPGTGHGLHFVKKVVEVHGGVVGYEPKPLGNNFFFVLPLKSEPGPSKEDGF
ncbi:ATP-binding protein [Thermosulfuriphilus sp.]